MRDSFDDILAANAEYAEHFALQGLAAPAAKGLGVLTCIDSRIEPLAMLGLSAGDAKIFRNAGARVTEDVLRTLALATNLLEVRRIMVVAHTDCAMCGTTDEQLRAKVLERGGPVLDPALPLLASPDPHVSLRVDLERLRASGMLAPGVVVGAFVYDVHTGLLEPVSEQA
jgi:carbonic anhydrase